MVHDVTLRILVYFPYFFKKQNEAYEITLLSACVSSPQKKFLGVHEALLSVYPL
jgi:hypothetical protein